MKLTDQDIEAIAQRIAGDLRGASASAPAKSAAPAASVAPPAPAASPAPASGDKSAPKAAGKRTVYTPD